MTQRKLGWSTAKAALEKSGKHTSTTGVLKLSDGSFAALARIHFSENYTKSHRDFLLRDGTWSGDTLAERGMVDPAWEASARTHLR